MDGYQYRVILSNYLGSVTSEVAALTVNAASTAPKVTTHPSNQTVKEGKRRALAPRLLELRHLRSMAVKLRQRVYLE